jgi:signal transduction histidine kinase/CheY-like chemotaxis protein
MKNENRTPKTWRRENRKKLRPMVVTWVIVFGIYCGLLLLEGLFMGGDVYVSVVTFIAGSGLLAGLIFMLIVIPHTFIAPLFLAVSSQIVFIIVGSYLKELDFYFFVMLMIVGIVSTLKNFKLLAWCFLLMTAINIIMLVFYVPHLEWLYSYRFFMNFVLFLYGSAFMLFQTYSVTSKESRSERALAAFSSFLHNTPNYTLITDSNNRVRYISTAMLEFTRFMRNEFAEGQPLIDLFPEKALKIMFADILDTQELCDKVIKIKIDGKDKYYRVVSNKLSDTIDDRFIDIADVTSMEESRLAAEEARFNAEVANKSKSNFLATMSHEIRTPMNAIIGISQIQMQKGDLPADYREALENIHNAGDNLLGIINDILDMSKVETGKLELTLAEYDVPSLINDAAQVNAVRIGSKPIELILDISHELPQKLYGDELRLKQILNNMLSNAIKYTEKGHVILSVSHATENDDVSLFFIIEDTGQGMTLEDRDRLFSEYTRFNVEANRSTEGTGLGLSITKKLVEMMDGTIWAETEYGKGSVFIITVKQKSVGSDAIGAELSEQLSDFTFKGHKQIAALQLVYEPMPYGSVLIVDDVETNLYVAKGLMNPYKMKIETAGSGFAALNFVNSGVEYDIIFMDHMMPKMDGIETTKKLRESGYTNPIIALTANAVVGQAEIFLQNGFDDFISKPIDIYQLDNLLLKYIRDKAPPEAIENAKYETASESIPETADGADNELLAIFVRDARKAFEIIEDVVNKINTAEDEDLRSYVINIHAMKSALGNIGEHEMSKLADVLEQAGKKQDKTIIAQETPLFLKNLSVIIEKNDKTNNDDDESAADSDPAFLQKQLDIIIEACEDYDDIAVESALKALKQMQWSKETKEALEKIAEYILHSDFEEAAEYAGTLIIGI